MRRLLLTLVAAGSLAASAAAQQQTEDEPARPPRLKRGVPKPGDARGEAAPELKPIDLPASSLPPAVREIVTDADGNVVAERGTPGPALQGAEAIDDPILKARIRSEEFGEQIPAFLCDQITFRHEGIGWPKPTWKLKDRVTAELMHADGAESYRNIKVSSKVPLIGRNKDPEKTGQWSRGDWVTVIRDVMSTSTDARFTADGEEAIGGRAARRYRYRVLQANSHWRIEPQGQSIKPAYRGRVWIDKETYDVLRVEMEARELPSTFPWNVVETVTELANVPIAGKTFLLPVKSENLSCQRDTVTCHRNEIEFRNYRRFSAESTISTTDSSVTFDGAEAPPATAPPPSAKTGKPKKK